MVIVDGVHHEDIWRAWIEEGASDLRVKVFIHAKHPDRVTSEWVRARLIAEQFSPEWNSTEVVRAMLALLAAGVSDSEACERYLFATESCIPVVSAQEACRTLFCEDVSWLAASSVPKSNWERANCFATVDPNIIPPRVSLYESRLSV